jgi:hypothetical protein
MTGRQTGHYQQGQKKSHHIAYFFRKKIRKGTPLKLNDSRSLFSR